MLGHRLLVGAGLADDGDAGLGAGVHVDHVIAGARRGHRQQARATRDQRGVTEPRLTQIAAWQHVIAVRRGEVAPSVGFWRRERQPRQIDVVARAEQTPGDRVDPALEIGEALDVGWHGRGTPG